MYTIVSSNTVEIRGLSTDTKPVSSLTSRVTFGNGSSFLEMDTGKIFYYDAESNAWLDPTSQGE